MVTTYHRSHKQINMNQRNMFKIYLNTGFVNARPSMKPPPSSAQIICSLHSFGWTAPLGLSLPIGTGEVMITDGRASTFNQSRAEKDFYSSSSEDFPRAATITWSVQISDAVPPACHHAHIKDAVVICIAARDTSHQLQES